MKIQVIARPTVMSDSNKFEFTEEELNNRLENSVQSLVDRVVQSEICSSREEAIVYVAEFLSSNSNLISELDKMIAFNQLNDLTQVIVLTET